MTMTGRVRVRVVAASCMLVLAAGVLWTGAQAWAPAQAVDRCRQAAATPAAVPGKVLAAPAQPVAAPAQPVAAPVRGGKAVARSAKQRRPGYAPAGSWRSHALRAVGC